MQAKKGSIFKVGWGEGCSAMAYSLSLKYESVLTSLTCEGHSLPLQTSSHENTGSPAASTEITVDREKEKRAHTHTLSTQWEHRSMYRKD